ncbi:MAG: hypothetical protein OK442_02070 [Thaumarchaeota archaeon]|nr:hypothetical protein [Nitrososphaerota archaeon]
MFGIRRQKDENTERPRYISVYAYINAGLFSPVDAPFGAARTAQG